MMRLAFQHLITVTELVIGTFAGAVLAEVATLRWLRHHKPHLNKNNDLEL